MSTLAEVFLGVIALSSLVQAVFLIGLARGGMRLSKRVTQMQERYDRELRPLVDHASRVSRNLAEVSDLAVLQVRRVDGLVSDTLERVDQAAGQINRLIVKPLGPITDVAALLKGLRVAVDVYRDLSVSDRRPRPSRRTVEEDEHLFI